MCTLITNDFCGWMLLFAWLFILVLVFGCLEKQHEALQEDNGSLRDAVMNRQRQVSKKGHTQDVKPPTYEDSSIERV